VNFGCPHPDCGEPYLTYHHFDPPWNVEHHHRPEGMIALCPKHAALADGGSWTKEQLVEMKKNPFVKNDKITANYEYLRKNVVCFFGNIAYNVQNVLVINGERVIGFEKDVNGYDRLNLLIRDANGLPVLVMENNDWTVYNKNIHDLECSTQGRILGIISEDQRTNLTMRFEEFGLDEFRTLLLKRMEQSSSLIPKWLKEKQGDSFIQKINYHQIELVERIISEIGSPKSIPVWSFKGTLQWGKILLRISDFGIEDERGNTFSMSFMVRSKTVFSYNY